MIATAVPAAAAVPPAWGYVWADQPSTASYTPSLAYQRNSTGGRNTIFHLGTGGYRVIFSNLNKAGTNGGTVDVTAYQSSGYCSVDTWGPAPDFYDVWVLVFCFAPGGAAADTVFDVTYASPGSAFPKHLAFVWADQPTSPSYTPNPTYQFNSGGGHQTITHQGTGAYSVTVPGIGLNSGTVKVSGTNGFDAPCRVTSWSGQPDLGVHVLCTDSSGNPADELFTMTWVDSASLLTVKGHHWGYVWADLPNATSTYSPSPFYQANSSGASNTVTPLATGDYRVDMPNLGVSHGDVQVTAYGSAADICNTYGWGPNGTTQQVYVQCFDMTGAPVNDYFTVQYYL